MEHIFRYSTNKDNEDYLMVNVRKDLDGLFTESIPENIKKETEQIVSIFSQYQKENNDTFFQKIALRKDSVLGKFILSHPEIFFNDDDYISYDKIVNAYNVAVFENDDKMANKILPLFKSRMSGMKEEFSSFPEKVISYISRNFDFYYYLNSKDNVYQYLVYEDGTYQRKSLIPNHKMKQKK